MKTPASPSPEALDLVDALVQLSFLVQARLGAIAATHDLSLVQVRLLGILRDRRPGMLELAAALGLDKSSVTGLIDRAERRGLVKRSYSDEDRRAVFVSLTAAGRALAEGFGKQMKRELGLLTAGLSAGSRERLAAVAGKIVADEASHSGRLRRPRG
jgi:DNA-binding MarR family transcriptional regulator